MPRHGEHINDVVSIQLLNPQVYQPGDVVVGTVTVRAPVGVPPSQTLRVKLLGRAKTKITRSGGQHKSIARGRAFFVQVIQELNIRTCAVEQKPSGAQVWPFDLEIPQKHIKTPASDDYPDAPPFLSNKDPDKVAQYEMPSIFYYTGRSDLTGTVQEAYVEYWLEATPSTTTATANAASYPLFVRPRAGTETHPTRDFAMGTRQYPQAITTHRLLPAFADPATKLTLGQRSRRLFARSTVPRYAFRVLVHVAGTYQLDHPEPLPVQVWIAPLLGEGDNKTNIYTAEKDYLPPVKLVAVEAELVSECHTRTSGSMWTNAETSKETKYPFGSAAWNQPTATGKKGAVPPVLPVSMDAESAAFNNTSPLRKCWIAPPADALDLGEILGLRVSHQTTEFMGRRRAGATGGFAKNNIYPSFATYNIALEHKLTLRLRLECRGEQRNVEVKEVPLRLLPMSEAQAREREEALGTEGMQRNYDDLKAAVENGEVVISGVVDTVASIFGG